MADAEVHPCDFCSADTGSADEILCLACRGKQERERAVAHTREVCLCYDCRTHTEGT